MIRVNGLPTTGGPNDHLYPGSGPQSHGGEARPHLSRADIEEFKKWRAVEMALDPNAPEPTVMEFLEQRELLAGMRSGGGGGPASSPPPSASSSGSSRTSVQPSVIDPELLRMDQNLTIQGQFDAIQQQIRGIQTQLAAKQADAGNSSEDNEDIRPRKRSKKDDPPMYILCKRGAELSAIEAAARRTLQVSASGYMHAYTQVI